MSQNKPNIVLISVPLPLRSKPVEDLLVNFLDLLEPICGKVILLCANFSPSAVSGRRIQVIPMRYDTRRDIIFFKAVKFLWMQLRLAYRLWRIPKREYDAVFFYIGSTSLLPVLVARAQRKKVAMLVPGSPSPTLRNLYGWMGKWLFYPVGRFLELSCYKLVHQLNVESESVVSFLELKKFASKIVINGALYIDPDLFSPKRDFERREPIIGYIGRLSWEKGVMNLVRAVPQVLEQYPDAVFLIGGEGYLFGEMAAEVERLHVNHAVQFIPWVAHKDLPQVLSELKLFVLPSYTEGVPGTVQEAMACGTPVLSTNVGGVPDLIEDEVTGFLLPNNDPQTIAQHIVRALAHPNLPKLALNGRQLIIREYTYQALAEKCRKAIQVLINSSQTLASVSKISRKDIP